VATKNYVDTQVASVTAGAMPAGCLTPYAGASAPTGWLLCYGQAVSRTTYAALFSAIGTTYGSGDGSTTFNLPDLRGRVAAGVDNMGGSAQNRITSAVSGITGTTLGAAGGDQRLDAHTHGITDPGHTHAHNGTAAANYAGSGGLQGTQTTVKMTITSATTGITVNSNTEGGTAQNVQPTIMLSYIIKT
jgi:microcystin-dependent protein